MSERIDQIRSRIKRRVLSEIDERRGWALESSGLGLGDGWVKMKRGER